MTSQDSRIVAFIPVRGGSKSIPQKNIKLLAGKPLVFYAIDAALRSEQVDCVVVATDAEYIRETILSHYPETSRLQLVNRSAATATEMASTESAMLEFAQVFEFNHIVLIQATSPMISPEDIDGGIAKYLESGAGGLLSVVRQKRFIWQTEGSVAAPVNYDFRNRPRRQDFNGFLVENGAFYITSRKSLLQSGCRISEPVLTWEMAEETYFELDEPSDWTIIEGLLKNRAVNSGEKVFSQIKLFLTDVDGVLTDAGMYYGEDGVELKKFNTRDGKAFELLRNNGIKTGIITAENTKIVGWRAAKIKADFLYQGVTDKCKVLDAIIEQTGFKKHEIAYIGDDLNDIEIIQRVGLSACPADAVDEVKQVANFTMQRAGGEGAVREFAELILNTSK